MKTFSIYGKFKIITCLIVFQTLNTAMNVRIVFFLLQKQNGRMQKECECHRREELRGHHDPSCRRQTPSVGRPDVELKSEWARTTILCWELPFAFSRSFTRTAVRITSPPMTRRRVAAAAERMLRFVRKGCAPPLRPRRWLSTARTPRKVS